MAAIRHPRPLSRGPTPDRPIPPAVAALAALGVAILAVVFALSLSNALEIGKLADATYGGFKENVVEQSASLSRVVFAAYRVLDFRSEPGEGAEAAVERKIALCAGLISHAAYVPTGGFAAAKGLLKGDPLLLAERVADSDRDYAAAIGALGDALARARAAPTAAARAEALDRFAVRTADLISLLQARSALLIQMEDYVYTSAREDISHLLRHSRRFILYFGILAAAIIAGTALYLRSLYRAMVELAEHRNHLGELVELRTAELTRANEQLRGEVAERAKVEELLRKALAAKELLIKEVHHRVKNNLAILKGLIELQGEYGAKEGALHDLESRLDAVAIIHDKLYRSDDLESIEAGEYLRDLAASLVRNLRDDPGSIRVSVESAEIRLKADTLVTLGLVVAEIVTNSLKHGFAARRSGTVSIRAERSSGGLVLEVRDDGVPPADAAALLGSGSLGSVLIRGLCEQLRGEMEVSVEGGVAYRFRFPELGGPGGPP